MKRVKVEILLLTVEKGLDDVNSPGFTISIVERKGAMVVAGQGDKPPARSLGIEVYISDAFAIEVTAKIRIKDVAGEESAKSVGVLGKGLEGRHGESLLVERFREGKRHHA